MRMNEDGTFELDRNDDAIPCELCKGYAGRVECTAEERDKYGCGKNWDCCSRAFVCIKCGHRMATDAPAPEME